VKARKDHLVSEYERRIRYDERSVAIEIMGYDAVRLLSMSRADAERILREKIEQKIKKTIMAESAQRLTTALESSTTQAGAMVLTLKELSERWQVLRTGLSGSNEFLGGSTPMRHCMELIEAIFDKEMNSAPSGSQFMLFIVSDGDSMDGDPLPAAARLKERGVEIISCFVSSSDVLQGKHVYTDSSPAWPRGARTMFDMASRVGTNSAEFNYLEKAGWRVRRGEAERGVLSIFLKLTGTRNASPKLFAQVNHSSLLNEFLKVVLAPLYAESRSGQAR
jgi:hypothetical protein